MTRTLRLVLASTVLAGATAAGFGLATAPASADAAVSLPVESVEQVVADGVHQRVFVSDLAGMKLVTTDYAGKVLSTSTGLNGLQGLALSADSSRLYAAWSGGHAILAYDTATSNPVATYALGVDVSPERLAVQGNKIWFGYESSDFHGKIGSVDLAAGTPKVTLFDQDPLLDWADAPLLTTAGPHTLVAADPNISDAQHAVLDTSTGTPVRGAVRQFEGYGIDLATSPDGSRVYTVGPISIADALSPADLSTVEHFAPTSERFYATSVAVRSDGVVAVGDSDDRTQAVSIFKPGSATPVKQLDLQADGVSLARRGLAWEPGGTRLFAVVSSSNGYSFQVLNDPLAPPASPPVVVTKPTTLTVDRNGGIYAYGTTVTFTAKLGPTAANRVLELWADPYGTDQPNRLLRKATVDSRGALTLSVKLTRNTTVSAVFAGDAGTKAITTRSTVYAKASVATAVSRHYKVAKIGSTPYFYLHKKANPYFTTAIPPYPGRKQYLQIDLYSGGKWKAWRSGYFALDRTGKSFTELTGTHPVGARYRVRSAYLWSRSGDTANYTNYGAYRYFTFTK